MKYIKNQDWAGLNEKFNSADPFPSICIDDFLEQEFARELARCYPKFDEARNIGFEFSSVNEKQKIQITSPDDFPDRVRELQSDLSSTEFLQAMESLSGIEGLVFDPHYDGGGMHLTNRSGILDVHVDFNKSEKLQLYRRLNILIYLNEEWDPEWGGEVELWDRDVRNCVQRFSPRLGRCLIFATSDFSFHGVHSVRCPEGKSRNSFAIYLYNKEPADLLHDEFHCTIFKARPTEPYKKYISMPIESCVRGISRQVGIGKRRLKQLINN